MKITQAKRLRQNRQRVLLVFCLSLFNFVGELPVKSAPEIEEPSLGQIIEKQCTAPKPVAEPLDLNLLNATTAPPAPIVTRNTISQEGLTDPSLWWASEQFGGKLLDNWLAYPGETGGRVDLVVNRQFWSLLSYLERYQFVNEFGLVAQDYRYNIRVFNPQGAFLAAYTCAGESNSSLCRICLESTARAGD